MSVSCSCLALSPEGVWQPLAVCFGCNFAVFVCFHQSHPSENTEILQVKAKSWNFTTFSRKYYIYIFTFFPHTVFLQIFPIIHSIGPNLNVLWKKVYIVVGVIFYNGELTQHTSMQVIIAVLSFYIACALSANRFWEWSAHCTVPGSWCEGWCCRCHTTDGAIVVDCSCPRPLLKADLGGRVVFTLTHPHCYEGQSWVNFEMSRWHCSCLRMM